MCYVSVCISDVLHRQITNATCSGKLFRENELTACEGSRRSLASHGTRPACTTGTADMPPPVLVEGPVSNVCRADEWCTHCRGFGAASTTATRRMVQDGRGNAAIVLDQRHLHRRQASCRPGYQTRAPHRFYSCTDSCTHLARS